MVDCSRLIKLNIKTLLGFFLSLIILLPITAMAQSTMPVPSDNTANTLSVKAQYGVDIDADNPNKKNNYLYGLHVSYDKNIANSDQEWVKFVNAKNLSLGLTWNNLNQMKEIVNGVSYSGGQAFGALAEVDLQLLNLNKARLLLTPGLGLAYITETTSTQPATTTIGSHINLMITGELSLEVPISKNTDLVAGGHILHYSNGAIRVPNGGWNMIAGSLGIKTALNKPKNNEPSDTLKNIDNYPQIEGNSAELWLGMGFRGAYRDNHKKFYRSGAYLGYNFYLNRALSIKMGSHMVYYHTVFDPSRFNETYQYYGSSLDRVRWGLAAGLDFTMGRFVMNAMYGKYLHYRNHHNVKWYWVYGMRYFFTPNVGIQSTFNLHGAQADYINWGVIFKL